MLSRAFLCHITEGEGGTQKSEFQIWKRHLYRKVLRKRNCNFWLLYVTFLQLYAHRILSYEVKNLLQYWWITKQKKIDSCITFLNLFIQERWNICFMTRGEPEGSTWPLETLAPIPACGNETLLVMTSEDSLIVNCQLTMSVYRDSLSGKKCLKRWLKWKQTISTGKLLWRCCHLGQERSMKKESSKTWVNSNILEYENCEAWSICSWVTQKEGLNGFIHLTSLSTDQKTLSLTYKWSVNLYFSNKKGGKFHIHF